MRVRLIGKSNKRAGYESEVYTVHDCIKVDVHSTFTPGTFVKYEVIKNGEGEDKGEGDQPIKQKCRIRKRSSLPDPEI